MSLLAIPFPEIDPVAFSLGPVAVRWYGLAYLAGLVLGWLYIRRLISEDRLWPAGRAPFPVTATDDLLLFMTIGVVLGGRLGSVLLYEPGYYLRHPIEIFMIWKGGMAFHGALIGTGAAIWLFARVKKVSALSTMDLCAAAVPIGLFFGRLANFINGELWGRVTTAPWGMVFPDVGRYLGSLPEAQRQALGWNPLDPRHPSQLYEAALEGLVLFIVLRVLTHHRDALKRPGQVVGTFLAGYGVFRSTAELFRQPDSFHAFTAWGLTPGIVYSVPMILLGIAFIWNARRSQAAGATA
ncbi:MAG: prolipoprotein diacylglyceryl transferase [Hyphomicrobiaceae bacterium]